MVSCAKPYISIVIPTKDRVELAKKVVSHILAQTNQDFEIVLVDNGSTSDLYDWAVSLNDLRVRSHRSGGLSMPENWDFALSKAQGEYVIIVNDKTIYRDGCILKVASILKNERPDFLTWVIGGGASLKVKNSIETIKIENKAVVDYFLACRIDKYQRFAPRGTNSAIKNKLLKSIRNKYGDLCRPVSPDYSLSAFVLSECVQGIHLAEKLAYVIPGAPSNTEEVKLINTLNEGYFSTLKYENDRYFSFVPCNIISINNSLLNDLLETMSLISGNKLKIDINEYYLMIFSDILISFKQKYTYREQLNHVIKALRSEKITFRMKWVLYIFYRFSQGYPSRHLKMRSNLPDFLLLLKMLFLNRPKLF